MKTVNQTYQETLRNEKHEYNPSCPSDTIMSWCLSLVGQRWDVRARRLQPHDRVSELRRESHGERGQPATAGGEALRTHGGRPHDAGRTKKPNDGSAEVVAPQWPALQRAALQRPAHQRAAPAADALHSSQSLNRWWDYRTEMIWFTGSDGNKTIQKRRELMMNPNVFTCNRCAVASGVLSSVNVSFWVID